MAPHTFKPNSYARWVSYLSLVGSMLSPALQAEEIKDETLRKQVVRDFSAFLTEAGEKADISPFSGKREAKRGASRLDPRSEISKMSQDGHWAMGVVTEVLGPYEDAAPTSRYFLAQKQGNRWIIGHDGTDTYYALVEKAPADFLSDDERRAYRAANLPPQGLAGNASLMGLPWKTGIAWSSAGIHGNGGSTRPFNAIDFDGGDGRVLAPMDGILRKGCEQNGNWLVELVHDNGYTTGYFHLTNITNAPIGSKVKAGDYLGKISNATPCGGFSSGPHVHFTLKRGTQQIAVDGKTFGGWTFYEGNQAYGGYATRNGKRVNLPGNGLINDGPPSTQPTPKPGSTTPNGTVRVPTSQGVANIRANPSLKAQVLLTERNGATLALQCHVFGDDVNGTSGQTTLWYRLVAGGWISGGFIDTGSDTPITQPCPEK